MNYMIASFAVIGVLRYCIGELCAMRDLFRGAQTAQESLCRIHCLTNAKGISKQQAQDKSCL
jgi:hypothetical protein